MRVCVGIGASVHAFMRPCVYACVNSVYVICLFSIEKS